MLREIEAACGLTFTGIVNNSNLGEETTLADVTATASEAEALAGLAGLPVVFTAARAEIAAPGMLPLTLQKKYY